MPLLFNVANNAGAVFASDTPGCIFPLYDGIPVCIGIGSKEDELIPQWAGIMQKFHETRNVTPEDDFSVYVTVFMIFLKSSGVNVGNGEGLNLTFCGYGDNDIFLKYRSISIVPDGNGSFIENDYYEVDLDQMRNDTAFGVTGEEDEIVNIIRGVSLDFEQQFVDLYAKYARKYKRRLVEAAKKTGNEDIIQVAKSQDPDMNAEYFHDALRRSIADDNERKFIAAVRSFNMEDLIAMSENLVNVSGTQNFYRGNHSEQHFTREIAIVTRAEGFVWIKRA